MEVKIGVQHAAREIVLESAQTADEVLALVTAAVSGSTLLVINDDKGRSVIVPGDRLAYVELGATERSRIGFGAS